MMMGDIMTAEKIKAPIDLPSESAGRAVVRVSDNCLSCNFDAYVLHISNDRSRSGGGVCQ